MGIKHQDFVRDIEQRPRPILDRGDRIPGVDRAVAYDVRSFI